MSKLNMRRLAVCGVGALGLALTAQGYAAHAQNTAYEYPPYAQGNPGADDEVTVIAPRLQNKDPGTGAPEEFARVSRVVYYDDLDLSSRWGANELHDRIAAAARDACREVDAEYPVAAPDNRSCISRAIHRAMNQVPVTYTTPYRGDERYYDSEYESR